MWHLLKRHPIPIEAHFAHSLVLTWALPRPILQPLLTPGLTIDAYEDYGFIAIALVQTRALRPRGLPKIIGQNFFLSGYRIFTRYTTPQKRNLRGLQILRSDTDKLLMQKMGNLLTHYNYHLARVKFHIQQSELSINITTPSARADLSVWAHLDSIPAPLPENSPFGDTEQARHFAGPLPWTFDYEKATHSIVRIKGVRKTWNPQPIRVEVERCTFFERAPFEQCTPILANAFYLSDVPYRWERGVRDIIKN